MHASNLDALVDAWPGKTAMLGAVVFFLTGLLTGSWKYFCIRKSPKAEAPAYVNIAHRAALFYAFASVLIAIVATLSAFPNTVNLIATAVLMAYFALTVGRYIYLGVINVTDNQHRNPPNRSAELAMLLSVMIAEIGGFSVLAIGFVLHVFCGW